jgi:hypothetical protein
LEGRYDAVGDERGAFRFGMLDGRPVFIRPYGSLFEDRPPLYLS